MTGGAAFSSGVASCHVGTRFQASPSTQKARLHRRGVLERGRRPRVVHDEQDASDERGGTEAEGDPAGALDRAQVLVVDPRRRRRADRTDEADGQTGERDRTAERDDDDAQDEPRPSRRGSR